MNARPRPIDPEPEEREDIDPATGLARSFVATTELARVLLEHRRRYIAAGGPLKSVEDILQELALWNGETDDGSS